MLVYLVRRLFYGALVVFATAVFAYGGIRALRPDIPAYQGTPWLTGTWHDVTQALLHLDFGVTCMYTGCPRLHDLWVQGLFIDVTLLVGALLIGAIAGYLIGRCVRRAPRVRRRARHRGRRDGPLLRAAVRPGLPHAAGL